MNIISDLQLIKTYEKKPVTYPLNMLDNWSIKGDFHVLNQYLDVYRLNLSYNYQTTFSPNASDEIRNEIKRKSAQTINGHIYGPTISVLYEIAMSVRAMDYDRSLELIDMLITQLKDVGYEQI